MVQIKFICTLIAVWLAILHQSNAATAVSAIPCGNNNAGCTAIQHSECNGATNSPMCKCSAGFVENSIDKSTCVKGPVITDTTCVPASGGAATCTAVNPNAECPASTTKCACTANYFLNTEKTVCLQKITTVDCTPPGATGTAACQKIDPNSECKTAGIKCTCKTGYTGTDSCAQASAQVAVSATLCGTKNAGCKDQHSECDGAAISPKCKCSAGYEEASGDKSTCVKSPVITDTNCNHASDGATTCGGVDVNAECLADTNKCACKSDYFLSSEQNKCAQKITTVACTPAHATDGDTKCQQVDTKSECSADKKCACKAGYSGTDSCTEKAGSSATSAWMATSLIVTSLLIYLPRVI